MKFAHMADVHIGSWRDPKMSRIGILAFRKAISMCILEKVDFVLIAGDLFNTSLPSIDWLKEVVVTLKEVRDAGIRVYMVAGSHDFSPSGKTMLDVLEGADLIVNVVKGSIVDDKLKLQFTQDKTGAKITGMLGKKGMLEKQYYENLMTHNLESEDGFKIFMFHTALTEFKPKELALMDSAPISMLPKGFNYYAGGHVHYIFEKDEPGYGLITYPGALFPNNFGELEKYGCGGFYIYENDSVRWEKVSIYGHTGLSLKINHEAPLEVEQKLVRLVLDLDCKDKLVTLRLSGTLESGQLSDIDFKRIFDTLYDRGAYFVMKNTSQVKTKEFSEVNVEILDIKEVEDKLIKEHLDQVVLDGDQENFIKQLMMSLNTQKLEGERKVDFEKRIVDDIKRVLKIDIVD